MEPTTQPITFISYSRRQLYFAEAVALHLQKAGLNVWFDLQQLKAGSVWAKGLKDGIGNAGSLVLVVSRASLASTYVRDEWQGVANKGSQLVLAVFEPVELPEDLQGLPTYDFRKGVDKKMETLTAYLKGEAEPHYDKIPAPNLLRDLFKTPRAVYLIAFTYFTPLLIFLASGVALGLSLFALLLGLRYGIPFLLRKQIYRKARRSVLFVGILGLLQFIICLVDLFFTDDGESMGYTIPCLLVGLFVQGYNLFVYYRLFGRSRALLYWMEPEDDLQELRRRFHQPLLKEELASINIKEEVALAHEKEEKENDSITFAVHHDPADRPLARWLVKTFDTIGHKHVEVDENPPYHIAILSNRSSLAKIQELTQSYAGQLIFVVASTIEMTEELKEAKVDQYQWVDAREIDKRDIIGLAKSLGNHIAGQHAALESTPGKIEDWKIPSGLRLLRTTLVMFAMVCFFQPSYLLVLRFLIGEGADITTGDYLLSAFLLVLGVGNFWLITKGVIKRKIPALTMYAVALLNCIVISWNIPMSEFFYSFWILFSITIILFVFSAIKGYVWFPAKAAINEDEIGLKAEVISAARKRNLGIVILPAVLFLVVLIWELIRDTFFDVDW